MKMNYFVAGTNDMARAMAFYDALFEGAGLMKMVASDRMTYWLGEGFAFAVALPFDGKAASHGNGTMFGFDPGSVAEVDRLYEKALELGGTCEGTPGPRGPQYTAYVRDMDRNKLCFSVAQS